MKHLSQIQKECTKDYEKYGQSAVFSYANNHNKSILKDKMGIEISFEYCKACACQSPSVAHECLVCGQETKKD